MFGKDLYCSVRPQENHPGYVRGNVVGWGGVWRWDAWHAWHVRPGPWFAFGPRLPDDIDVLIFRILSSISLNSPLSPSNLTPVLQVQRVKGTLLPKWQMMRRSRRSWSSWTFRKLNVCPRPRHWRRRFPSACRSALPSCKRSWRSFLEIFPKTRNWNLSSQTKDIEACWSSYRPTNYVSGIHNHIFKQKFLESCFNWFCVRFHASPGSLGSCRLLRRSWLRSTTKWMMRTAKGLQKVFLLRFLFKLLGPSCRRVFAFCHQ